MEDETKKIDEVEVKEETPEVLPVAPVAPSPVASRSSSPRTGQSGQRNERNDRRPSRAPRAKPEFDQRILAIRRVTRVSSGGRRFSFSVAIVVGNRKGVVGVGTGKAGDTSLAIDKAVRDAKKHSITVRTTKTMSIPHEVFAKEKSAIVHMQPAKGKGIIAGSAVRDVIELAGLKDINAKLRSPSKNKLNSARATIKALLSLKTHKLTSLKAPQL